MAISPNRAAAGKPRSTVRAGRPEKVRLLPPQVTAFLHHRAIEAGGLLVTAFGLLLIAVILTYSPADPSFDTSTNPAIDQPILNVLGRPGADVADLLMQLLGLAAYLIGAIIMGWGLRIMSHRGVKFLPLRLALALIGVVFATITLSTIPRFDSWPLTQAHLGGASGEVLLPALAVLGGRWLGAIAPTSIATVAGVLALLTLGASLQVSLRDLKPDHLGQSALAGGRMLLAFGRFLGRSALSGGVLAFRGMRRGSAGVFEGFGRSRTSARPGDPSPAPDTGRTDHRAPPFTAPRFTDASFTDAPFAEPPFSDPTGDQPASDAFAFPDPDLAPGSLRARRQDGPTDLDRPDDPGPSRPAPARPAPSQIDGFREEDPLPGLEHRRIAMPTVPTLRTAAPRPESPGHGERPGQVEKHAERTEALARPIIDVEPVAEDDYELPPVTLLQRPPPNHLPATQTPEALHRNAGELEGVLSDFGVRGTIAQAHPGPVVTLYELEPAPGTKSSRVIGLADDIARSMSAVSVRVAVVPGRNVIGVELPNAKREMVYLRELLEHESYQRTSAKLPLILGKDIGGGPIIADLSRMPHLLVAGTTGSGKSVAINVMILSLLYRMPPDRCRFIMVDPKMLELSVYEGIPHLLAPVVTESKKAVVALKWAVREMEDRYRAMSKLGVRNIEGYNARLREARANNESLTRRVQTGFDPDTGKPLFEDQPLDLTELPYIVIVVDEMADLMLVAGKDIEATIQRLAQMARAAGLHLIMATQRPSVDVITGTIKANFPTRISFQVTSKIDSRTILGEQGAEQLLGQGDMLYMAGGGRITRVHGPFVRDDEVEKIVSHLKMQGEPNYVEAVTEDQEELPALEEEGGTGRGGSGDELYDRAVELVSRERKASTSFVQRHLQIGYNRAARLIERMEQEGVVSQANHVGKREVLARNIDDRDRLN
ncbi:MAG: DNA translocase FtsK [Azospirillaceae bacterium]|nr:DNA translocase FtsK [Azospirillaceae bacterium]